MSSSKVDCHFFLTSSCRNGDQCPFRHSEGARNTEETCSDYAQTGKCAAADCGKRHTEVAARTTKPPSEVMCRNEENGGTCTRAGCKFKHLRSILPSGGLNAGAKVFVPRPTRPTRPERPAAMEWTPGSKASRPPTRSHANMEWTPAMATTAPASSKPPPMPGAAGLWLQAGQQRVVGRPRVAASTMARPQRPFAASAFVAGRPRQPPPPQVVALSDNSQGMDVDMESSDEPLEVAQPKTSRQVRPAVKESSLVASSIPTIYDILGIPEQTPVVADRSAKDRRTTQRARASTTSLIPSVTFSPTPSALIATHAPIFTPQKASVVPDVTLICDSIQPIHTSGIEPAPRVESHAASSVTATVHMHVPAPKIVVETSKPAEEEVAVSSNERNPLRAMASLDDLEVSEEDDSKGECKTVLGNLQPTSSPLAPPSQTLASAHVLAVPEAKAEIAQSMIVVKSRIVPPPRAAKTSSPRLGMAADPVVSASPVPKILSFQEIMERKRRKQVEANNVEEVKSPVAEAQSPVVGAAHALAGKRRIIVDEDDVESDASDGKRARPEPPVVQQPLVSEAIPDYVAMFERELEDLTAGLDGPLENTPAGDMISRATLASSPFLDQDICLEYDV
ncbi:hypothetical protein GGI20_004712 [Coemansia sp. BCRC 34301]|nr:hypothetical protein GGI20_004712 [Coemansia sp. BCRC 34301]